MRVRPSRLHTAALTTALVAGLLCGCATTVAGMGSHEGAANPSAESAQLSSDLSARISAAMSSVVSAHLLETVSASSLNLTAEGDETFAAGVVTGLRIASSLLGVKVVLLLANGQSYAQLPTVSTAAKPWVKVDATSKTLEVRSLYQQMQTLREGTSQQALAGFAGAASKIVTQPRTTIDGVSVTPYDLTIDVDQLPASQSRTTLQGSGVKTLNATLYLDGAYRVVRLKEAGSVRGQTFDTTVTLTSYNQAVNIAAPAPSQVSTD